MLLCHIDSRMDIEYAMKICELGANICLDHVGRELADRDQFRVEMITELVRAGFAGRVTLSGDMGKKGYLPAYGGKPGLAYILTPDFPLSNAGNPPRKYISSAPRVGEGQEAGQGVEAW